MAKMMIWMGSSVGRWNRLEKWVQGGVEIEEVEDYSKVRVVCRNCKLWLRKGWWVL